MAPCQVLISGTEPYINLNGIIYCPVETEKETIIPLTKKPDIYDLSQIDLKSHKDKKVCNDILEINTLQQVEMAFNFNDILKAKANIDGKVVRTPALHARTLSAFAGCDISLKLENLQVTGSFKPRGALNKLLSLDDKTKARGVIAASAGNHAQGVAYHAANLNIQATIFMPEHTPFTKVQKTEDLGAQIVLSGNDLSEAKLAAFELQKKTGAEFIDPYDDPLIMAGQGTTAIEFLEDCPDLDYLIIPIGGGGLAAGMAVAAKEINPDIKIYGVEADRYPSMSMVLGRDIKPVEGPTIAEGIAVKKPGHLTAPVIDALLDDIFLVDETAMEDAVQRYLQSQRLVTEGAGAASLAALLVNKSLFEGKHVGLVVSGGNIDSRLLSSILMRGLVKEGRVVRLRIGINDIPGALGKLTGLIGDEGGNIVEVYHQRMFYDVPVKEADVDVVVETLDIDHVNTIMAALENAGFPTRLIGAKSTGEQI